MITPRYDTGSGSEDGVFVFYRSSADLLYLIPYEDDILGGIKMLTHKLLEAITNDPIGTMFDQTVN